MGLIEDILNDLFLYGIVQSGKDSNGDPDTFKAAGIAAGLGHDSADDWATLGTILGGEGAFDSGGNAVYGPYDWRKYCRDGAEYNIFPENYETIEEYSKALIDAKYGWKKKHIQDQLDFDVDPDDYETEEEYEEAIEEEKAIWRGMHEEDFDKYGIDPEDYDTEIEYEEAIEEAKEWWRSEHEEDFDKYGIDPEDYDTEEEYEEAIEEQKAFWRSEHEEDFEKYGIDPEDYDTEAEYEDAIEEAIEEAEEQCVYIQIGDEITDKTAEQIKEIMELYHFLPTEDNSEAPAKSLSEILKDVDSTEILNGLYESDFPNKRTYQALCEKIKCECTNVMFSDKKAKEKTLALYDFILENHHKLTAAGYITLSGDFLYAQAVQDNFNMLLPLPEEDLTQEIGFEEMIEKIYRIDRREAFEVWDWCIDRFVPYMEYSNDTEDKLTDRIVTSGAYNNDFFSIMAEYSERKPDFAVKLIYCSRELVRDYGTLLFKLLERNNEKLAKGLFIVCADGGNANSENLSRIIREMVNLCVCSDDELVDPRIIRDGFISVYKEKYPHAANDRIAECEKKLEEKQKKRDEERKKEYEKRLADDKKYICCGVKPDGYSDTVYHYLGDESVKVGDKVKVPAGVKNTIITGTVVSVGEYLNVAAPFPVEKMKKIIEVVDEWE